MAKQPARDLPPWTFELPDRQQRYLSVKRIIDILLTLNALIVFSPLLILAAIGIKLSSPGPILYGAKRVGQNGKHFTMYKFRTMTVQQGTGASLITARNDRRIFPFGALLRKLKIDELPQLFNILRGDMSIVGPRPEDVNIVEKYFTAEYRRTLLVKPGLASPGSIYNYTHGEKILGQQETEKLYVEKLLPTKMALELVYTFEASLAYDIQIIFRTFCTVFAIARGRDLFSNPPEIRRAQQLGILRQPAPVVNDDTPAVAPESRVHDFASWILKMRNRHIFGLDLIAICVVSFLSFVISENGNWPWSKESINGLLLFGSMALFVNLSIFYSVGLYDRYWRYAGLNDLIKVATASGWSTLILFILSEAVRNFTFGNVIQNVSINFLMPILFGLFFFWAAAGNRLALRVASRWQRQAHSDEPEQQILIVGAGEAGRIVVNEILANPQLGMRVIGFVDDDELKQNAHIENLPVMGTISEIPKLVGQYRVRQIIVAMPSAPLSRQHEVMTICKQCDVITHNLPGVYQLLAGYKTVSSYPQIDVNRLLGREPISTDHGEVGTLIKDAVVLVTGAGGSIGSELCRQIARQNPAELILLGRGENSVFEIGLELRINYPKIKTRSLIIDVRDQRRINAAFESFRPEIVFHAAAHKHVPFMEENVEEAVVNNVHGTQNIVHAAERYGVKRLVMISSDKAVNPSSVMGATKRLGELIVQSTARRSGNAYMAVRFGNVLGSRGSVIPIFQRQIAAGGPVTVTHPDMDRYFMTIPEAVHLVLEAAVIGSGGEVFLLDMGKPVRILDLARNLIKLSGYEPYRDIQIVHAGIRPGEKLSEELFLSNENYQQTHHAKVFVAKRNLELDPETLDAELNSLIEQARRLERQGVLQSIHALIPEYHSQN